MKDQDIVTLLKKLKNDPDFNRGFDVDASWNLVSKRCGLDADTAQESYGVRDYLEYYVWQFSHVMFKPLVVSMAVFVLLIGSWMGASSASNNALPGDRFYSLKLSLEKAQMSLAFAPAQKAKLQVEFTSNRLEEMVELSATAYKQDSNAVLLAIREFKKEVQNIQADLKSETQTSTQTALAKEIGRKSNSYKVTVADSGTNASEDVKDEVDQVQALLKEAEEDAVQVILTAHESTADESTAFELENAFEKELAAVQALDLDTQALAKVDQAIALKKEGAYRRAFQLLKEVTLGIQN